MTRVGQLIGIGLFLFNHLAFANSKDVNLVKKAQSFQQGNKVAIVVGVEAYDRRLTGFRKLDYAADDAVRMANTLTRLGYQVERLTNQQATKGVILNRIKQKAKRLKKGEGTLLFYFSGHGLTAGNDNYLATYGSVANDLSEDGLGLSNLANTIRKAGVKRAVLLVDACRNNPRPGIKSGEESFKNVDVGEGVQVLYSTRHGDVSYEHDDLQQGVFSHFLIEALSGKAKQNGLVTFNGLANYVEQNVANWTDRNMSQTQQPFRGSVGEYYGDFVLAQSGSTTIPTPEIPKQPEPQTVSFTRPEPEAVTLKQESRKSFEPEMVSIPSGSFTMGCVTGRDDVEGGCYKKEKPAHQVSLSAFQIGQYEVTFDQWDVCAKAKACPPAKDSGFGRGQRPVSNVSWDDTQQYIKWLNQQTGKNYRLPTEAEWEYAARAGGDFAYPWGNTISCKNADYNYEDCNSRGTSIVGSYQANNFGLYDTVGNVLEWTQDWYGNYSNTSVSNPKGASSGTDRVLRGGSWVYNGRSVRSAYRIPYTPGDRYYSIGFRLARGQ